MQAKFRHSLMPLGLALSYKGRMALTLRIRELRQERGLTLAQLASMISVSAPHLSEIERGKKNLNNHLIERLSAALDVPPSALITGSQDVQLLSDIADKLSPADRKRVEDFALALLQSQPESEQN